jgi:ATP-dependent Zn protease
MADSGTSSDVSRLRERRRRMRLLRGFAVLAVLAIWCLGRRLAGQPLTPPLPSVDPILVMTGLFFLAMMGATLGSFVFAGKSPHVVYRPDQIDVRFDDVVGLAAVTEDVRRSLDLFLSGRTFRRDMGGTPRRGLLFEGPPGTGKTHMAKAMAAEAGVPFLFVSATSFQSMFYGATSRKIRAYFKALRKAARTEGGAIGFIEEIDAIAMTRGGLASTPAPALGGHGAGSVHADCGGLVGLPAFAHSGSQVLPSAVVHRSSVADGVGGVVNELLVQMQSFDTPTWGERAQGFVVDTVNLVLPAAWRIPRPRVEPVDVLVIAATNRADGLDPALLRPGRFDRRLSFDAPDQAGRRALVDHFLARKAHEGELDDDERRDALAGVTQGYTPVMIEHLMDEALVNAVRRGARGMSWADLEHARLVSEIGLGQPLGYTEHEKRLIATHEAGHATLAWLVAPERRLEVLTIIKRASALGLLAHGDRADVYTRSRRELEALVCIAFGGQVAEEMFFGDVSTGPGGDLAYATNVAVQMVGQAGMSDTLISFSAVSGSAFTDTGLAGRVLGDSDGRRMVEVLLRTQKERARELMEANSHLVVALRDALLERHELIGREITDVLERAVRVSEPAGPTGPLDLAEIARASAAQQRAAELTRRSGRPTDAGHQVRAAAVASAGSVVPVPLGVQLRVGHRTPPAVIDLRTTTAGELRGGPGSARAAGRRAVARPDRRGRRRWEPLLQQEIDTPTA